MTTGKICMAPCHETTKYALRTQGDHYSISFSSQIGNFFTTTNKTVMLVNIL